MSLRSYQAIVTKYLPPTNLKGSRIKATAAAGSLTLPWDHALNSEENHARAAEALANRFKWRSQWFMGGLPDDAGYCFVGTDHVSPQLNAAFRTPGRIA